MTFHDQARAHHKARTDATPGCDASQASQQRWMAALLASADDVPRLIHEGERLARENAEARSVIEALTAWNVRDLYSTPGSWDGGGW